LVVEISSSGDVLRLTEAAVQFPVNNFALIGDAKRNVGTIAYARLLEKLERAREALGGRDSVYDVLGELFEDKPLRDPRKSGKVVNGY
jgi:hypothetical protein